MTEADRLRAIVQNALTTEENAQGTIIRLENQLDLLKSELSRLELDSVSPLFPRLFQAQDNLDSIDAILSEVKEQLEILVLTL